MDILHAGDPRLESTCEAVRPGDPDLTREIDALHAALRQFREEHGYGRAIAAPQLGVLKRFICVNLGATPFTLINPEITWRSDENFEVWDDCLSVPDVIVRVRRHRSISLTYLDEQGRRREWLELPEAMSELIQHEIDHLDGVLMTARAVDDDAIRPIAEHAQRVPRPRHRLDLENIKRAAETIDPVFLHSPQFVDEALSASLGCELLVKLETANPIRSFKGRGADFFMKSRSMENSAGLVCASAGNFGQALAYGARKHGLPLTVFASLHANRQKVERMRAFGADVRLAGEDFDAAKDAARQFAEQNGATMVEDGREPEISEGAGTIGVELLAAGEIIDDLLVPLGNGALLAGVARWVKAACPATRVYGVCSTVADAMERSWRTGHIVESGSVDTIADGIAVRVPVPEAVEDLDGLIDDVLTVDDQTIRRAMHLLFAEGGLVVEPAGAVGVAAILAEPDRFAGRRVATILCGSHLGDSPFLLAPESP